MWQNILIVIIVGMLGYGAVLYANRDAKPRIIVQDEQALSGEAMPGDVAPDFSFIDRRGERYTLRDFEGKVVLLNFWASWCTPCIKEFPDLLALAEESPDDVVLIALSSDLDESAMNKFLDKMAPESLINDNILIALDEDGQVTTGLYKVYALPETLIIDRNSRLRRRLIGADWAVDEVREILSAL